MKPIRQIFCIGARRPKLAFDSEAKADRYILFNMEEIAAQSGKIPARSYFCLFCCAWHVTSISDPDIGTEYDLRDRNRWEMIELLGNMAPSDGPDRLMNYRRMMDEMFAEAFGLFEQCREFLSRAQLEEALDNYAHLHLLFNKIKNKIRPKNLFPEKTERLKLRLQTLQNTFLTISRFDFDSESRRAFMMSDSIPKDNLAIDYFLAKEKALGNNYNPKNSSSL